MKCHRKHQKILLNLIKFTVYLEDKYLETNKYLEDLDSNSLLGGLGLGQETVAQVASYRRVVTSLMGQLQRTARARDL